MNCSGGKEQPGVPMRVHDVVEFGLRRRLGVTRMKCGRYDSLQPRRAALHMIKVEVTSVVVRKSA